MEYKLKPFKHQVEAVELSRKHDDLALLWEMGTGKTGGMVLILRDKCEQYKELQRTVIFSPIVTLENWRQEILMHSYIPPTQIHVASKPGQKRIKLIEDVVKGGTGILILNYEAILNAKVRKLLAMWAPQILICDESHLIKNHASKRGKYMFELASMESLKHRYILTGTPILNSPMDLYQQYKVLDLGSTFGKNFFAYRAEYFFDENAQWSSKHNYFPKFVPIKNKFEELTYKVYRKASRVLKKECLDLPPFIVKNIRIPMAGEQKAAYEDMKKELITFVHDLKKDTTHASVAMQATTKAIRLQQICCGFIKTEDGNEVPFVHNPKLDMTRELVQQITPDHKLIIWTSFIASYTMLADMLDGIGVEYVLLTGQQTNEEKENAITRFNTDKKCRVIISNRKTGGAGINLTSAAYSIVYGRDFNLGNELQSEARNYRAGSEAHESVTKINLVMEDTIDELVMQALESKQEVSKVILDML